MMEIGSMVSLKRASALTLTGNYMRANGRRANLMDMELKHGLITESMKANGVRASL